MPRLKSRNEFSDNRLKLEPKRDSSKIQSILAYDLCGWKQGRIAEAVGLTQSRVSIIMRSPIYQEQRQLAWTQAQGSVIEKRSQTAVDGDPVIKLFKDSALDAAKGKIRMSQEAESEFVKNSALSEILDRAGYKAEQKKVVTSVEVTEKMAERWSRVLERGEQASVKIRTEVSNES